MSAFRCNINAAVFARAVIAQSTEETRYWLNGVYVEPAPNGGALLVATNGHILVCLHDPDALVAGAGIVNLPPALLKACKPSRRAPGPRLEIENDTASVAGLQCAKVLIDGSFPDYRRIIPRDLDPAAGVLDQFDPVNVLAPLAKALSPGGHVNALRLIAPKKRNPGGWNPCLALGYDPAGFGVAMPVTDKGVIRRDDVPAWFTAAPTSAAVTAPAEAA
jgi:hypothetical protein